MRNNLKQSMAKREIFVTQCKLEGLSTAHTSRTDLDL